MPKRYEVKIDIRNDREARKAYMDKHVAIMNDAYQIFGYQISEEDKEAFLNDQHVLDNYDRARRINDKIEHQEAICQELVKKHGLEINRGLARVAHLFLKTDGSKESEEENVKFLTECSTKGPHGGQDKLLELLDKCAKYPQDAIYPTNDEEMFEAAEKNMPVIAMMFAFSSMAETGLQSKYPEISRFVDENKRLIENAGDIHQMIQRYSDPTYLLIPPTNMPDAAMKEQAGAMLTMKGNEFDILGRQCIKDGIKDYKYVVSEENGKEVLKDNSTNAYVSSYGILMPYIYPKNAKIKSLMDQGIMPKGQFAGKYHMTDEDGNVISTAKGCDMIYAGKAVGFRPWTEEEKKKLALEMNCAQFGPAPKSVTDMYNAIKGMYEEFSKKENTGFTITAESARMMAALKDLVENSKDVVSEVSGGLLAAENFMKNVKTAQAAVQNYYDIKAGQKRNSLREKRFGMAGNLLAIMNNKAAERELNSALKEHPLTKDDAVMSLHERYAEVKKFYKQLSECHTSGTTLTREFEKMDNALKTLITGNPAFGMNDDGTYPEPTDQDIKKFTDSMDAARDAVSEYAFIKAGQKRNATRQERFAIANELSQVLDATKEKELFKDSEPVVILDDELEEDAELNDDLIRNDSMVNENIIDTTELK